MLFLSACTASAPKLNQPLNSPPTGIRTDNKRSEDLTIILSFSGGGTRAAALSYGVMKQLHQTSVVINHKKRRLLDEVDLISSVSGGSFTSAYYGLFGDRIFHDFERKFLKRQVQSDLIDFALLSPKSWIRLLPGLFERSDLAVEYYNQFIFKNKRFSDMREDAPHIIINATDLSLGQGFAFTNYHFGWICSDLANYPVARAVAASSAVPILFSPITLKNHASKCNYTPTFWKSSDKTDKTKKRYKQTLNIKKYRDNDKYKYLHLVDGGVADNLGVRSMLDLVTYHRNNMWNLLNTYRITKTKRMVFIIVNAQGFPDPYIPKNRVTPSTLKVLERATAIQFKNYNVETMDLLRDKFPEWQKQIQDGRCRNTHAANCKDISFDLIEVNLQDIKEDEKKDLLFVPTSLELPPETVDKLEAAGANLLQRSKPYQKLLKDLKRGL